MAHRYWGGGGRRIKVQRQLGKVTAISISTKKLNV
jgi:hypothetical protein